MNSLIRSTMIAASVVTIVGMNDAVASPLVDVRDNGSILGTDTAAFTHASARFTTNGGTTQSRTAGAFGLQFNVQGDSPDAGWKNFVTYCFEVSQTLDLPTTYDAQLLASAAGGLSGSFATKAAAIERLWAAHFASATTNANNSGQNGIYSRAERSAAFQLATWEIATDGFDGLSNGLIRVSQSTGSEKDVYDLVVQYLQDAYNPNGAREKLYSLLNPYKQDLLIPCADLFGASDPRCGGGGIGVPVPATLVLFGAGLIALAGMRRLKA